MNGALASFTQFEVVFKVAVSLRDFPHRLDGFIAQGCAAHIGVQDDAGGIDYRGQ